MLKLGLVVYMHFGDRDAPPPPYNAMTPASFTFHDNVAEAADGDGGDVEELQ